MAQVTLQLEPSVALFYTRIAQYSGLTLEQVHEAGLEVNCWTVDDPKEAARMISYGVDYITSNILE